jgi:hypothetical protein
VTVRDLHRVAAGFARRARIQSGTSAGHLTMRALT